MRQKLHAFRQRFHNAILLGMGVFVALTASFLYDVSKPPPQRLTQRDIDAAVARAMASATPKPSYASRVFEIIRPSLVRVQAAASRDDAKPKVALGTGVVIEDSGTILTCLHVVGDAAAALVTFADGTESMASVVLRQRDQDLALLRPVEIPDDLVPATLESVDGLRVGDEVFAVGNPFGVSNSLSAGVVSGLGRVYESPTTGETLRNLIQFDAAVNPGNSGGPLLDRDGDVVGIVVALLNPSEQDVFIGIGFAVPIGTAAGMLGSPPY